MKKTVVEPAYVDQNQNFWAVTEQKGDELFFPHVDSCLAVVVEYKNGKLAGVHVPQIWEDGGEFSLAAMEANLRRGLKEAKIDLADASIQNIHCVGHDNWDELSILQTVFFRHRYTFKETAPSGSDVTVTHGMKGIQVANSPQNSAAATPVASSSVVDLFSVPAPSAVQGLAGGGSGLPAQVSGAAGSGAAIPVSSNQNALWNSQPSGQNKAPAVSQSVKLAAS